MAHVCKLHLCWGFLRTIQPLTLLSFCQHFVIIKNVFFLQTDPISAQQILARINIASVEPGLLLVGVGLLKRSNNPEQLYVDLVQEFAWALHHRHFLMQIIVICLLSLVITGWIAWIAAILVVIRGEKLVGIIKNLVKIVKSSWVKLKMIVLRGASFWALMRFLFRLATAALHFFLEFCFAHEIVADSKLVTHDDMCKTYSFLGLLISVFVLVKLWVNGAELQVQTTFKF